MLARLIRNHPFVFSVRVMCGIALASSALVALIASRHWPLIGDSALLHYIIFLQKQQFTPYKDILDINLPGAYLFEAAAMRYFGPGAVGWRLYDFFLLCSITAAALRLAGRRRLFAGVFAGAFFALVHLQDGFAQAGQRDLLMTALLLWSYVALFLAEKNPKLSSFMALICGVLLGTTATIKPVLIPLGLILLLLSATIAYQRGRSPWFLLVASAVGLSILGVTLLLWLQQQGALPAFLNLCTGLLPLHASLGRRPLSFLLSHCLSPIAPLVAVWLILQWLERRRLSVERLQLLIGVLGTALAYVLQGKGYPYQRYPLLALSLVLIGIDLDRAISTKGASRVLGVATCLIAGLVLAPRYAWLSTTFSIQNALPRCSFCAAPSSRLT